MRTRKLSRIMRPRRPRIPRAVRRIIEDEQRTETEETLAFLRRLAFELAEIPKLKRLAHECLERAAKLSAKTGFR